ISRRQQLLSYLAHHGGTAADFDPMRLTSVPAAPLNGNFGVGDTYNLPWRFTKTPWPFTDLKIDPNIAQLDSALGDERGHVSAEAEPYLQSGQPAVVISMITVAGNTPAFSSATYKSDQICPYEESASGADADKPIEVVVVPDPINPNKTVNLIRRKHIFFGNVAT